MGLNEMNNRRTDSTCLCHYNQDKVKQHNKTRECSPFGMFSMTGNIFMTIYYLRGSSRSSKQRRLLTPLIVALKKGVLRHQSRLIQCVKRQCKHCNVSLKVFFMVKTCVIYSCHLSLIHITCFERLH